MSDPTIDDRGDYRPPRKSRTGRYLIVALLLIGLCYWVSPYVAAVRFAQAVQSGSSEAVTARIDVASLRNAFARQIVRAYLAKNPQTQALDGLARQAVTGVATGYVSGIISDYLTPEAIADLLRQGRARTQAGALLGETAPFPRLDDAAAAWRVFRASGFSGLTTFAVRPDSSAEAVGLVFGLDGAGWPLKAVELPPSTLDRLAQELATRIDRKG